MNAALKRIDDWTNQNRPLSLLGTLALTIALVALANWASGSDLFQQLFFPKPCDPKTPLQCSPLEWKELFQAAVLVLGLPVAFLLWHWRDRNVRDQIENTRQDLNYREFSEIQIRLAGAIDKDISDKSKIALQTAALFQMSEFLTGKRGEQFSRPTFEAIRAKFAGDFEDTFSKRFKREIREVDEIYSNIIHHRFKKYNRLFTLFSHSSLDLKEMRELYRRDPSKRMNLRYFVENFEGVFIKNENARFFDISLLPIPDVVEGKNLRGIQAIGSIFLGKKIQNVHFSGSNLLGATFREAVISGCDFERARLDLAQFSNSKLENCNFSYATLRKMQLQYVDPLGHQLRSSKLVKCNFEGADLTWAQLGEQDLTDTNFSSATLICTDFGKCDVAGSNFSNCDLRGANMTRIDPRLLKSCEGARFDDSTSFHLPAPGTTLSSTNEQLQEIRELWRSCGARHINDP